ncbi:hypothetical protein NBRC116187_34360 [Halopseudomonas sabulinigri]|uniref:Uncharacterized protein n=1 Tax=Halopseudomonas sabulinigri TaxID=472181 RepID=A0ABP9ZUE3_9GAMM
MSKALAVIGNVLAFFIFGVGLLSPLTPSVGMPTMGSLVTFVALPLMFLLNARRGYTHQVARYAVVFQGLCFLVLTAWLLSIQSGVFANASLQLDQVRSLLLTGGDSLGAVSYAYNAGRLALLSEAG